MKYPLDNSAVMQSQGSKTNDRACLAADMLTMITSLHNAAAFAGRGRNRRGRLGANSESRWSQADSGNLWLKTQASQKLL